MEAAVTITGLTVELADKKILRNINVSLPKGHIIGLLGPSGAGKTTLMRVIVGRQKFQGEVDIYGLPAGDAAHRSQIGYMPQSPSVYPDLTVNENVRYFATMIGASKSEADKVIERVGLQPFQKQLVSKLSGGQRSRVSLATALLGKPKLLILDEPTVGVDPILRQQLWELFIELAREGSTLIISSHVMDEASRCQDLLLLREGTVLDLDTPAALLEKTKSESVEGAFTRLVQEKL